MPKGKIVSAPAFLILLIPFLLTRCSELPHITLLSGPESHDFFGLCNQAFPRHPWRALHTIHITGPFNQKNAVIGATIVVPAERRIRAVIMTIEGMVLFDADYSFGVTTCRRAVPPLDHPAFGEGLLRDVSMMFLPLEGERHQIGRDPEGRLICRWINSAQETTDIIAGDNGERHIHHYDRKGKLKRTITMSPPQKNILSQEVELVSYGFPGYTLQLKLLEQEPLSDYENLFTP